MRPGLLLLVAALIPSTIPAQQPADTSVHGDSGLVSPSLDDVMAPYVAGARFSDMLVVRGARAGLRVSPASGTLGLIGQLRFRGPQTLIDDRQPLVILDGMRLDAASGLLGGAARLEDLNPEDIESVEVLSPAQAVGYGPDAANGVLVVKTRQAQRGAARWTGYADVGTRASYAGWPGFVGGFDAGNPDTLLRNGGCSLREVAANSCVQDSVAAWASPLSRQTRTALQRQFGVSVTGGWDPVSYYVAGELDGDGSPLSLSRDEITRLQSTGEAVPNSIRYPQHVGGASVRANIRVQPVRSVSINLHGIRVSQDIRAPGFVNDLPGGATLYDLQTGYLKPGDAFQVQTMSNVSRWLGSVDVEWAATHALTLNGTFGHDGVRQTSSRQNDTVMTLAERVVFNSENFGLGASYAWGFSGLALKSHVGFESSRINRDSLECATSCVSGVAYRTSELTYHQRFSSLILEQRATIHDALELVGTIRRDAFKYWSQKPVHGSLHAGWTHGTLRLRADYGSAGRRQFLFPKAESTRELSTGFDVTTRLGRFGFGATVYDMRSSMFAPVYVSGPSAYQLSLVPGAIGNRGIELNATARLIERPDMTLTLDASAWGNRNRLVALNLPVTVVTAPQQRSTVGAPVGGWWAFLSPAYADLNGNGIIEQNELSGPVDVTWAGSPYPTQGATFAPELRLRAVRFGASLDYQAGHTVFNRNHWYACLDGHCPWAVDRATPFDEQADVAYARAVPRFFEDGDFLALRELWISLDVPRAVVTALHVKSASLTVAGRNLHTWTGYSGISPEPYAVEAPFGVFEEPFGQPDAFTEPVMPALPQWSLRVRVSY